MAGQLTIDTLKASTGVLATQNGMTGIAKAWVYFDGTPASPTINGSFNISSVTKVSSGIFNITMTTAMPSTNYATVATCRTAGFYNGIAQIDSNTSTSVFNYRSINANGLAAVDMVMNSVAVFSS